MHLLPTFAFSLVVSLLKLSSKYPSVTTAPLCFSCNSVRDLGEREWGSVDWIQLAWDRAQ